MGAIGIENKTVQFHYTNYKGIRSVRTVRVNKIERGLNPHLTQPTWLLWGVDREKKEERAFVLDNIENLQVIEDFQRHFCVTVYVADESFSKFAFVRHKKLNKWLPPGGHVESNETPDAAALREVFEETGLKVKFVGEPLPFGNLITPLGNQLNVITEGVHEHMDLIYAAIATSESLTLNDLESNGIAWFTVDQIMKSDFDTFPSIQYWVQKITKEFGSQQ